MTDCIGTTTDTIPLVIRPESVAATVPAELTALDKATAEAMRRTTRLSPTFEEWTDDAGVSRKQLRLSIGGVVAEFTSDDCWRVSTYGCRESADFGTALEAMAAALSLQAREIRTWLANSPTLGVVPGEVQP